jgi:hypothetical protein
LKQIIASSPPCIWTLYLDLFEQPALQGVFQHPVKELTQKSENPPEILLPSGVENGACSTTRMKATGILSGL